MYRVWCLRFGPKENVGQRRVFGGPPYFGKLPSEVSMVQIGWPPKQFLGFRAQGPDRPPQKYLYIDCKTCGVDSFDSQGMLVACSGVCRS